MTRPGKTFGRAAPNVPIIKHHHLGMDQYLLIPFLVGWTSIYQLFWGSLGTRVLTHPHFVPVFYCEAPPLLSPKPSSHATSCRTSPTAAVELGGIGKSWTHRSYGVIYILYIYIYIYICVCVCVCYLDVYMNNIYTHKLLTHIIYI